MTIKPLRSFATIWADVEKAQEEARAIVDEGVKIQKRRSCDIYVDANGDVHKRGDFPDAPKSWGQPENSELIWYASSEANWKGKWEASRLLVMDRHKLENWLKKAREKLHHVSVAMNKRAKLNRVMVHDRLDRIENVTKQEHPTEREIKTAITDIDDIMTHLRSIQRELKMQVDRNLIKAK